MRTKLTGTVVSDKANKTRRVSVSRQYRHAKYGKFVRGRTICHVHDENNESKEGDRVEIVESRPRSRTKRWELVRILDAADQIAVEAAKAQAAADAEIEAAAAGTEKQQAQAEPAGEESQANEEANDEPETRDETEA
ncbi:MAG: 30S ribosomal protein S17 [Planctomycetota bacterium]|nr:MAG: 30S ribosomal protein S17 [Planctomycetota bacterium]REJ93073.1 MAG: 30S ribosomal protein S17 [Planctomycetota bacterium]REK30061.1 MAG: 30S ribosomal protein S17 [Planctomycetota bacterium]REK37697.1 MAG: 30S ribosomal protein S17 [Planctomycetota bacterium]